MNNYKRQDIEHLKLQVEQLKKQLQKLIDQWYYYQTSVYQEIMFEYDNIFGDIEEELENKIRTSQELEKRVEFLRMKLRQGENLRKNTMKLLDIMSSRQAERQHLRQSTNGASHNTHPKNELHQLKQINCEVNENYEISNLYRSLVKKLHPDVAGESEERRKYWESVQIAYKQKDAERLRVIQLLVDDNIYNQSKNEEAQLKTLILDLENNIKKQETKLKNLIYQEPFVFKDKLKDRFWIKKRKEQLQNRLIQINDRLRYQHHLLSNLTESLKNSQEKSRAV
ncbi:MAG TPA: hypothetical protein PLU67_05315 [Candidatus Kapabacteria bacterium]|nr:hypothetical protein [Candidatus Kapabacteria bacterium]HOM04900.1 hypothetical protein [Candidatus Kapabacteria bacterium]HPP39026.1 hypothetical protein [Candidatus Kapabacteria bacterium]HPU23117.1 hypothetical protein [Candidatus Kapabacteria bacterium]